MKSVLIVEDDVRLQRFYKSFIEMTFEGLHIFQALDGEEALASCSSFNHTVIITDIEMPNMGGIQFYKKLKETQPQLSERVAFISGSISGKNLTFIQQEERPYLLKPHSLEPFQDLIRSIIAREEEKFISRHGHQCKRRFARKKIKETCQISLPASIAPFHEPLVTEILDYSEGGLAINYDGPPLPCGEQCQVDIEAMNIAGKVATVAWAEASESRSKAGLMWI